MGISTYKPHDVYERVPASAEIPQRSKTEPSKILEEITEHNHEMLVGEFGIFLDEPRED